MDNVTLSFDCVDVEKLDYLGIKSLSMPIDRFDINRRAGIIFDVISYLEQILI